MCHNIFGEEIKPYLEKEIEIIKFKARHVDENGNVLHNITGPTFSNINGQEAFNRLAFTDVLMDSPCVYVFKKELFLNQKMFFKPNTYHEDFGLIPLILLSAKSVVSLDYYGYSYVQSEASIRDGDHRQCETVFDAGHGLLFPVGAGQYHTFYDTGRGIPVFCHSGGGI